MSLGGQVMRIDVGVVDATSAVRDVIEKSHVLLDQTKRWSPSLCAGRRNGQAGQASSSSGQALDRSSR